MWTCIHLFFMEVRSAPIFMVKTPVILLMREKMAVRKGKESLLARWFSLGMGPISTDTTTSLFHPNTWGPNFYFLVPIRFGCLESMIHSVLETLQFTLEFLL